MAEGSSGRQRSKRQRSVTESLGSIILGLEAIVVVFATFVVAGLAPIPPLVAYLGGAGLILVFLIAGYLMRYRFGVWLGWGLQAVLIALGLLNGAMFVVGLIFAGMWAYSILKAQAIDRQRAEHGFLEETA